MFLAFIHDGNVNDALGSQQKLSDLNIAHWCHAISRLHKLSLVCNLEIGMQFPDSENAQLNLEIAWNMMMCVYCVLVSASVPVWSEIVLQSVTVTVDVNRN